MEEALLPAGGGSVQRPGPGEAVKEEIQPGDPAGAGDRNPPALLGKAPGGLVAVPQPFGVGKPLRPESCARMIRLLGAGGDGKRGAEEQKQSEGPEFSHSAFPLCLNIP